MAPGVAPTVNLTPVSQQGPPGGPNGELGHMSSSYAHAAGGRGGMGGRGPPRGGGMGGPGGPGRGGGMGGRGGMMGPGPAGGGMRGGPPGGGGRGPGGPGGAPLAPAPPVPDEDYNFQEVSSLCGCWLAAWLCAAGCRLHPSAPLPLPTPSTVHHATQANRHFDKEAALAEAKDVVKPKQHSYVKDDFFDTVSCEALDKLQMMEGPSGQHRRNMHVRGGGWRVSG
jgi:hypothetical protein